MPHAITGIPIQGEIQDGAETSVYPVLQKTCRHRDQAHQWPLLPV